MIKKTLKLEGLDCSSCAFLIDDCLEELDGVKSASTNYASQICEVEFDPEQITDGEIKSAIENAGYSVVE
ncbi:MAG: heavy-metal-associated domain-containing protein [Candidatus Blackburnbacteria bacterium]|nr:heavy-metal-associated domain-containing protein [Candidatus Blackburnbacteria bacterium]